MMNKEKLVGLLKEASGIAGGFPRVAELKLSSDQCLTVVGDTHGDIDAVKKIEHQFFRDQASTDDDGLLFLGDYVDRDERDIENINHVLELLVKYPAKVILLRGNHEEYFTNADYGFLDNLAMHGMADYYRLYEDVFKRLPLACFLQDIAIFCCHGMTPVQSITFTEINKVKIIARRDNFDPITEQLLWNDPQMNSEDISRPNRRGIGREVGKKDLDEFMAVNGIKLIIRSHQSFPEGYRFFFGRKVLSIFSQPNYSGGLNDATIARVHGDGRVDVLQASAADEAFSIVDTLKLETG